MKLLKIFLIFLFFVLQYFLYFGKNGLMDYISIYNKNIVQKNKNKTLKHHNYQLFLYIKKLKNIK